MTPSAVETKVEQLLAVLDRDILHLEATLVHLDALRSRLIRRDDEALTQLLGDVKGQTETYAENEQLRQTLRVDLATALGCDTSGLTLSRLQSILPEPWRTALAERQKRLRSLITELKRQYTLTAVLVSDCARFNRALVRTVFGAANPAGVTYSSSGHARQRTNATLMSVRL